MGEKFNSGMGGYTCDTCSVLLWAGANGSKDKSKRIYCYRTEENDIIEKNGKIFCSKNCVKGVRNGSTKKV